MAAKSLHIIHVRTYIIEGVGSGGDYHNVKGGHWLIDSPIATPMSGWEKYRSSRTTWGINVLGSFCVEIEASNGVKGFATGFGGPPACWLAKQHFERFLIGAGESIRMDSSHMGSVAIFTKYPDHRGPQRPEKHELLVRADVPSVHVLRPKRTARRGHLRHRSCVVGSERQTMERTRLPITRRYHPRPSPFLLYWPRASRRKGNGFHRRQSTTTLWARSRTVRHAQQRGFPPKAPRKRRTGLSTARRLLHELERPLHHPAGQSMRRPQHRLVGRVLDARRQRRLRATQTRPSDRQVHHRRTRVLSLRLPQTHREPQPRYPPARRHVGGRHDRTPTHLRHGGRVRYPRGASRQRTVQLSLRRLAAQRTVPGIPGQFSGWQIGLARVWRPFRERADSDERVPRCLRLGQARIRTGTQSKRETGLWRSAASAESSEESRTTRNGIQNGT